MRFRLGGFEARAEMVPPPKDCQFTEFEGDTNHGYDDRDRRVQDPETGEWLPICRRHAAIMQRMAEERGIPQSWDHGLVVNGARLWPLTRRQILELLVWIAILVLVVLSLARAAQNVWRG